MFINNKYSNFKIFYVIILNESDNMKKIIKLLVIFVLAFVFCCSVKALTISADGEWHDLDNTAINHTGDYNCSSNNAAVQTKVVKVSSSESKCSVRATTAVSNVSLNWYVLYSGTKFSESSSTISTQSSSNVNYTESEDSGDISELCDVNENPGVMAAFKLGSIVITIIKIVVPIILIVFGMIDMAKAVVDGKDGAVIKQAIVFGKRIVACVLIFFVPSIILAIFNTVDSWDSTKSKFSSCFDCLLDTSKCPENVSLIKK